MELSVAQGLRLRAAALMLTPGAGGVRVADVVEWFGAMQAQDLASGLWSLGVRLPHLAKQDVEQALADGEALRTWPMRGTIHLVPSRDARWMLDVMGARALAGAAKRRATLGLDEGIAERAVEVLGDAIAAAGRLTRAQCVEALTAAGIDGSGNYAYHLLWYASQRGVTCIGPNQGSEQTFVLLDAVAPDPHRPSREEALATIAVRYFRSHGPTTVQDLAGWTGLTLTDVRRAVTLAGDRLSQVSVEGRPMYVATEALAAVMDQGFPAESGVVALPGFDEYLLGYKDRSWMVQPAHFDAIVPGGNGVFRSTIVRDGQVVATWTRTIGTSRVAVTVIPLVKLGSRDRTRVERALDSYARFLARPLAMTWADTAR